MSQIRVAAGVIFNAGNEVLLALRPLHKHQGGLWEFPGGKVEAGEKVEAALARELLEELNIVVGQAEPLLVTEHDYGDKQVVLDVWVVRKFSGDPHGREGQSLRWVPVAELAGYRFPKANEIIVARLLADSLKQSDKEST